MIPTRRRSLAPRTLFALEAVRTIEAAEADTKARRLILLAFSIPCLFNEFKLRRRAVYRAEPEIASPISLFIVHCSFVIAGGEISQRRMNIWRFPDNDK